MKIVDVREVGDNIFEVTYKPSFFEKLAGKTTTVKKYKLMDGHEYKNYSGLHPIIDLQTYDMVGFTDKAVGKINAYLLYKEYSK